jgi:hypothetical protein
VVHRYARRRQWRREYHSQAHRRLVAEGHDLIVVTSRSSIQITDIPIKNFLPIGEFELPEYELQKLSFPPILQMIDYVQREGFYRADHQHARARSALPR